MTKPEVYDGLRAIQTIRKRIGTVQFDNREEAVVAAKTPISQGIDRLIRSNPQEVRDRVRRIIRNAKREGGRPTDLSYAVAVVVQTSYGDILDAMAVRLVDDEKKRKAAGPVLDLAQGFKICLGALQMVWSEDAELEEQQLRDVEKIRELYKEDSTGYSILDRQIDRFKAGKQIRSYETKEMVVAGAELAREAYHKVYERVS